MKHSLLATAFLLCFPTMAVAQFKVASNGFSTSNNLTVDGATGYPSSGVLTVKSSLRNPGYSATNGSIMSLLYLQGKIAGIYLL